MKSSSVLTATIVMVSVWATAAANADVSMVIMKGTCTDLVVAGEPLEGCESKLLNSNLDNGRTGFYFTAGATVITFSGIGNQQLKINDDNVVQPIDELIIANSGTEHSGRSETYRAVGSCRYNNPYKGIAKVVCHADTQKGIFSGTFVSDGRAPEDVSPNVGNSDGSSHTPEAENTECVETLRMHGFLSRAQFQCGFKHYSSDLMNEAKACAHDMGDAQMRQQLLTGAKLFDRRERERGHKRLCQEILRDFSKSVKQ
jgi:hypothetical protein